jgi:hypothetical protein
MSWNTAALGGLDSITTPRLYGRRIMAEDLKLTSFSASFDPETVTILGNAVERAWHKVQTSGNRFARPGYVDVMRQVMVKHILHLAERGERDEIKLSDSAFRFFNENYRA